MVTAVNGGGTAGATPSEAMGKTGEDDHAVRQRDGQSVTYSDRGVRAMRQVAQHSMSLSASTRAVAAVWMSGSELESPA